MGVQQTMVDHNEDHDGDVVEASVVGPGVEADELPGHVPDLPEDPPVEQQGARQGDDEHYCQNG